MHFYRLLFIAAVLSFVSYPVLGQSANPDAASFTWPEGKKAAVSLSFDDARLSHVDVGLAFFEKHGGQVTFYVVPSNVEKRLEGWQKIAAAGHEIGNHSLNHPCTGNFRWSRANALETYTLKTMRRELVKANRQIEEALGVVPETFAYPCGQKFVGRGQQTKSYVPVVAEVFTAGRGWLDEAPNDPTYVDMPQLTGMSMDSKSFDEIKPLLEQVQESGQWLVLAGHDIGSGKGAQLTRTAMLKKLIEYAQDPANNLWLAPVGTVAKYVRKHRDETAEVSR